MQRGFTHIFLVVILLVIGIGVASFLVRNPQIFNPKASTIVSSTCQAGNIAEFKVCWELARQQQLDSIEITNQILCKEGECQAGNGGFVLSNTTRPLTIFGKPDSGAGFKRLNYSGYDLLFFIDTADVTIKDLIFDDSQAPCNANVGYCGSMLAFNAKSVRPVIDGITTLHAKNLAVQFGGREGVVKNSKFIGSWAYGVWMNRADLGGVDLNNFTNSKPLDEEKISRFTTVESNLFVDTGTAGINFSTVGTADRPNRLVNNFFYHNHSNPAYSTCGSNNNQTCPGGQLTLERNIHSLVEGNVVKDGNMDVYNSTRLNNEKIYTTGIETSDLLENIVIKGNVITRNSGSAIYGGYTTAVFQVKPETITITQNEISANGNDQNPDSKINQVVFPGTVNTLNCYVENCGTIKKAKIYADPPVCEIGPNSDRCTTTIKWVSNDSNDIKVKIRSNPEFNFGETPIGSREANFITSVGAHFDLYMDGTLVDTAFVKAYTPQVSSPSPAISPSPARKIGDLNGNGKVDIFDFNLFAGYFPSKDIRGDIDTNGRVDIFDFNTLLTNFGK
jgi:hypothetical protein